MLMILNFAMYDSGLYIQILGQFRRRTMCK